MKSYLDRTFQARFTPGHFGVHHNVMIEHEGSKIELESGAGSQDHVHVMDVGQGIWYVLAINYRMGYMGLTVYDVKHERKTMYDVNTRADYEVLPESHNVFFQDHQVEEALGADAWDIDHHALATKLSEWCYG